MKYCLKCGHGIGYPAGPAIKKKFCSTNCRVLAHKRKKKNTSHYLAADTLREGYQILENAGLSHFNFQFKETYLIHGAGPAMILVKALASR